jgi:hypothetical protein
MMPPFLLLPVVALVVEEVDDVEKMPLLLLVLITTGGGFDDAEGAHEVRVHVHDGSVVVELAAVVGRGEDGDEAAVGEELVAVLDHLVRPAQEVQVVPAEELGEHVGAEGVGDAPVVVGRPPGLPRGVGPEQVAEQAFVGHVARPGHVPDLLQAAQVRGDAAVHAQDAAVHQRRHGEPVEAVAEDAPEAHAVPALALVVEAVDAVHGGHLVVAAEEEQVLRVPQLVGEQQARRLDALLAAVHVVA